MIVAVPDSKTCPACSEDKPASAFHRDRQRPDGLTFYCASCVKRMREEPKRQRRDLANSTKQCAQCHRILKGVMFVAAATGDGLEARCRTCKSWRSRLPAPVDEVVTHEREMAEIFSVAMAEVRLRYHCKVEDVKRDHRSEFEQTVWSLMYRGQLLERWKPPVWLHSSSIPE